MTQVLLSVPSAVTGYLSSLKFPSFYYRNEERTYGPKKVATPLDKLTDAQETAENVKTVLINTLPFLPMLCSSSSRWISYGGSIAGLVRYIGRIHARPSYENSWGALKNFVELISTIYRLKVGLFMHSVMDFAESCYHFYGKGEWKELLPAAASGTYLLTLLPTSKKIHDSLVCASLACHGGINLYRAWEQYTDISKTPNPIDNDKIPNRDYYALYSKALLGIIRSVQAVKLGYDLIQEEKPVQRTVVIMRPASQKDPVTGGLTEKGKADAKSIASVVDRVAAEHGGKPAIFVSPLGNSQETGDIIGGNLKRPVGITTNDNLIERSKIGILGERQDELAHRLDGAVQEVLSKTDPQQIPFLVTHGDIAKKYVDEHRDLGGEVSEVFKRRLHTGEMIVLRRTGDEVVLVERIRAKKEVSSSASEKKA